MRLARAVAARPPGHAACAGGAGADRTSDGADSVVGAVIGGLLVGLAPAAVLKVVLGLILIAAAVKLSRHAASTSAASRR